MVSTTCGSNRSCTCTGHQWRGHEVPVLGCGRITLALSPRTSVKNTWPFCPCTPRAPHCLQRRGMFMNGDGDNSRHSKYWQSQEKNKENIVTIIIIRNLQRSLLFFVCLFVCLWLLLFVLCVCAFSPSKDLQNKKNVWSLTRISKTKQTVHYISKGSDQKCGNWNLTSETCFAGFS